MILDLSSLLKLITIFSIINGCYEIQTGACKIRICLISDQ